MEKIPDYIPLQRNSFGKTLGKIPRFWENIISRIVFSAFLFYFLYSK